MSLELPYADDFHVHLRQADIMKVVTPWVRRGGISRCIVMPNTTPPITTTAMAKEYRAQLMAADDGVDYMMTLYLSPEITLEDLGRAQEARVTGVKSYPRGVTTNSEAGVESYEQYYPIFEKMEELGLVLHLHGEVPNVCVLTAEEMFLKELETLHQNFPKLKIVLEHASTAAAVEMIQNLGATVCATVTCHHLELCVDDALGCCHNYCKPVPKLPCDLAALRRVVFSGNPKFFLGSDSAPHVRSKKEGPQAAAGVFTQPLLLAYLAHNFDKAGHLDKLIPFVSQFGSDFFGLPRHTEIKVRLVRREQTVPEMYGEDQLGGDGIVPFRRGQVLNWTLEII
eukprot:GEMP01051931.1.p1 GENE.GEMP01051931.1~~GEMP01051931.1.p1  ORF type:complete len:340 (-),score=61.75 GEMP01051931.1:484-1503(-)